MIPMAICWSSWEERNRRIFDGSSKPDWKLRDVVLSRLYDLSFYSSRGDCPSYVSWLFDWVIVELFFLFLCFLMLSPFFSSFSLSAACLMLFCSYFELFNIYFLSLKKKL